MELLKCDKKLTVNLQSIFYPLEKIWERLTGSFLTYIINIKITVAGLISQYHPILFLNIIILKCCQIKMSANDLASRCTGFAPKQNGRVLIAKIIRTNGCHNTVSLPSYLMEFNTDVIVRRTKEIYPFAQQTAMKQGWTYRTLQSIHTCLRCQLYSKYIIIRF